MGFAPESAPDSPPPLTCLGFARQAFSLFAILGMLHAATKHKAAHGGNLSMGGSRILDVSHEDLEHVFWNHHQRRT